jgi:hypothetical protein
MVAAAMSAIRAELLRLEELIPNAGNLDQLSTTLGGSLSDMATSSSRDEFEPHLDNEVINVSEQLEFLVSDTNMYSLYQG